MANFSVLPPEVNSALMFAGPGSAPMLEAAGAWAGLASELGSAASSFSSLTSDLASQAWQGPAAAAMLAAAAPYAGFLDAAANSAASAAGQASAVAEVFESAVTAMVHPVAVAANRNQFVQLVLSNLFGQNAPAIAAAEGIYEEMWATDVATMAGYHSGVSTAAAALTPWEQLREVVGAEAQAVQNFGGAEAQAFRNIGSAEMAAVQKLGRDEAAALQELGAGEQPLRRFARAQARALEDFAGAEAGALQAFGGAQAGAFRRFARDGSLPFIHAPAP